MSGENIQKWLLDEGLDDLIISPENHIDCVYVSDAIKKYVESRSPIANNGVSFRGIIDTCAHVACDAVHHVGFLNMSQQKKGEYIAKQIRALHAKLPTTAINNGVSFDSIVDKLTHLNGDHLMGLELNNIHIIANFITKLPTTSPRVSGEVKHADNCPSVKGAPVCTCEHLRRYS